MAIATINKQTKRLFVCLTILCCAIFDNIPSSSPPLQLTHTEKLWIENNPEVFFTGDPNWLPYEAFTENGTYIGLVADHLQIIEKMTGLRFKPIPVDSWSESLQIAIDGKVNVISGDAADAILNKRFNPVDAYSRNPIVIIMDHQQNYVEHLNEIKDRKIALIKDYGYTADIFNIILIFRLLRSKTSRKDWRELPAVNSMPCLPLWHWLAIIWLIWVFIILKLLAKPLLS